MKILVTGAGAVLGQGILRSLDERHTRDVHLIAADPNPLSAGLYWTPERYIIPMADDPRFMEQVEALIARTRPDVVIPGTDVELLAFALHRERLEQEYDTHVLVSPPEVVRIADDKWETFRFMREHGFAPPDSCLPGDEGDLIERVGFPLIVKPRVGARSVGVQKLVDREHLRRAIEETHDPVIQECVGEEGTEYTAGTLTFDGECRAAMAMRRDLRDGNTYRAWVERDPELICQVADFARALGAYGPANFQFRVTNGRARVFEINARFSGTTPLRAHAGFNEVLMCVRHLVKGEPVVMPALRDVVILRHLSETVLTPDTAPPPRPGD